MEQGGTAGVTVPKTNRDPILSLAPWSVEVPLGNETLEIEPLAAIDWLQFLLSTAPDIDGMITTIMPEIEDYVFDNDINFIEMYKTALSVLEIVAGRPWWVALRIISVAVGAWEIIGPKLAISGIDARNVSLASWLDVVLYLAIESMDPKKVTMFTLKIEAPPPRDMYGLNSTGDESEGEPIMSQDSFLAMA